MHESQFLTINDLVRMFNLSRSSIYRQIKAGALEIVKIGRSTRIPAKAARDWAERLGSQS